MSASSEISDYWARSQSNDSTIKTLYLDRQSYDYSPPFQRDKVWGLGLKQSLIDSIFRGLYMPPLLVNRVGRQNQVVDGQQRLTTLFDFRDDKFAMARLKDEPYTVPIEPGKRYSELSSEKQDIFDNYSVHLCILDSLDDQKLGILFRRLQHQQPLILAEKLWSYNSETTRKANELINHLFWTVIYSGQRVRKRTFQASLSLISIEIFNGYSNLTPSCLYDVASGNQDTLVSLELLETIRRRLSSVLHLFYGTSIQSIAEVIPLYQAAMFLESEFDLKKSDQGCLTSWYGHVKQDALLARKNNGRVDFLSKIIQSGYQRQFWMKEWPVVLGNKGLFPLHKRRAFSPLERLIAWNRQEGICPVCSKMVSCGEGAHHIVHFSKGGPTSAENCAVVHKECHAKIHASKDQDWEILKEDDEAA